ncbi:hypothetical protein DAI22_03g085201 [Oryza sativa Japonica Group]|nr:hypothetical protein DAI22_03g085201 [Oryza sativa Japonica Group]
MWMLVRSVGLPSLMLVILLCFYIARHICLLDLSAPKLYHYFVIPRSKPQSKGSLGFANDAKKDGVW